MSDALTIAGIVIVFAGLSGADAEFLFGRQRSQTIREALKNGNLTARRCLQCGLVCGMITSFMPVVLIDPASLRKYLYCHFASWSALSKDWPCLDLVDSWSNAGEVGRIAL